MKFPTSQFSKLSQKVAAKKSSKPKRKLESMEIHKATNGGYIAKHRFNQPEEYGRYAEPEEHVLPNSKALAKHVKQHMEDY